MQFKYKLRIKYKTTRSNPNGRHVPRVCQAKSLVWDWTEAHSGRNIRVVPNASHVWPCAACRRFSWAAPSRDKRMCKNHTTRSQPRILSPQASVACRGAAASSHEMQRHLGIEARKNESLVIWNAFLLNIAGGLDASHLQRPELRIEGHGDDVSCPAAGVQQREAHAQA